jgi:large subunit ribosomal protein L3
MKGLLGKKIAMTRIYDGDGVLRPATVLQVGPCVVLQKKTAATDGYAACQLGFERKKAKRATKAESGHAATAGAEAPRLVREFRFEGDPEVGAELKVSEVFDGVPFVDITGTTKGKGFQGVVKRYGFHGGPASHGAMAHRRPGSIGMCQTPGRVLRGQKMPGRTGARRRTVQNLRVLELHPDRNLMVVGGAVPGPNGAYVEVRTSLKRPAATKG